MSLLLYDHPLSSYAQKVKIVLREKGLPFTAAMPDAFGTGRMDGPFGAANPRLEVPVLVNEGIVLFDSTIILEYLEDRFPDPPLLPHDAAGRAHARLTEEVCDTHYEAVNWGWGEIFWFKRASGPLAEQLRRAAERQTVTLQNWLEARLGTARWFGGERFGWADAAVAPMLNRSHHYGFGPPAGGRLEVWYRRVCARTSAAETFAEFDLAAQHMADAPEHYTTGGRRREYRDHRLEWMIKSGGLDVVTTGLRDDNIRFSWP